MRSGLLGEVHDQTTVDHRKNELIWAPVFQKEDSAVHQINYHPVDNAIGFHDTVKRPLTATFFRRGGQKIHTSTLTLNLPTTVTFFCLQRGRCREVQLYLSASKSFF